MYIQLSRLHLRKTLSSLVLMTILGLSALGLSQCRLVDDTVTGIDASRSNTQFDNDDDDDNNNNNNNNNNRSRCEKQCNRDFKRCLETEERRHKMAKRACKNLPRREERECKKAESKRNEANERACNNDKKLCKRACRYREGAGRGGR